MAARKQSDKDPTASQPDLNREAIVEERRRRREEAVTVDGTESHQPVSADASDA